MTDLDIINKLRKMFVEKSGVIDGVTIPIARNRAGEIVAFDSPELVRFDLLNAIVHIQGEEDYIAAGDAWYFINEAREQLYGKEPQEITEHMLIISMLNRAGKLAIKEAKYMAGLIKANENKIKLNKTEENLDET